MIDAYFSGTKVKWILDNIPGAREKAEAGDLLFGTVETWLIWKLTKGRVHVTDYSNAARTMLFNINTLEWDDEILARTWIFQNQCFHRQDHPVKFMEWRTKLFWKGNSDREEQQEISRQHCLDRHALQQGRPKNTYGTGAFLLMNTGAETSIF